MEVTNPGLDQSAAAPAAPPISPAPEVKIGRFKASKLIAKSSWNLLKQDSEMLWFPVLSAFVSLIVLGLLGAFIFLVTLGGNLDNLEQGSAQVSSAVDLVFAFLTYFLTVFVTIFFQAGIITIVRGRLSGQNLTFGDGLKSSFSKIGKIAQWAVVAATVGIILRMISERSGWLGKIMVAIMGAAWSILIFFIAPILVAEDLGVKESLKKSAGTIRRVWGETVIINVGVGLFFSLLFLLGLAVFIATLFTMQAVIIIPAAILLVVFLVGLVVISSTLDVVFKTVLYEYASSGKVPQGFDPEVFRVAFKQAPPAKGILGIGGM